MLTEDTRPATELLLPVDFGRVADITPACVRALTARGRVVAAAITPGGVHLYTREEAERYAAERVARRRGSGAVPDAGSRRTS